jgi:hypothetical protein
LVLAGHYLSRRHLGSIVEIKRIQGAIFNSKEAAEQDGLRLCKEWIDKRPWRGANFMPN